VKSHLALLPQVVVHAPFLSSAVVSLAFILFAYLSTHFYLNFYSLVFLFLFSCSFFTAQIISYFELIWVIVYF